MLPMKAAVSGERISLSSRSAGQLNLYAAGPERDSGGPDRAPMLLVHSVNAAGSAYEVAPLYEHYRRSRAVYALELPGFGFSERSDRPYSPRLMTDAVLAATGEIARRHSGRPFDALALSLASEFLARAASERPAAYRSIALISPTGLDKRAPYRGAEGTNRGMPLLYKVFRFPLWSGGFFRALTSRASIRYFLRKTFGSKQIDEGLADYAYLTSHQPGARYAPYRFVSGYLFSLDITTVYEALRMPVWVAHGVRGGFTDYSYLKVLANRPNWTIDVFQTGALPHFEVLADVVRRYDSFLADVG